MIKLYDRQVKYLLYKGSPEPVRKLASFQSAETASLPAGDTIETVLTDAVTLAKPGLLRDVATDVFRHLVYSNHTGLGPSGDRPATLARLDEQFPFAGTIAEARRFHPGTHKSGKTDTCGAVLHLLLSSAAAPEVKHLIGGILMEMLRHAAFLKRKPIPYYPVIEEGA